MIQADVFQPALQGDPTALNRLFDHCRPRLYIIALRLCGNTPMAEDAVQEALLLAYTRLHQLKEPAAFLPWISRIVTNCCYQLLRNKKPLTTVEDYPDHHQLIEDSIHRRYEDMAKRDSLYTALSLLPEQLRSTMMLRYLSDYGSYTQIAGITGVPVGTVRSRLSEGKKQLARHWNQLQHAGTAEYGKSRYWNEFYTDLFPAIYDDPTYLPTLAATIDKSLKLIFTSGKTVCGRNIFMEGIYDDMEHGSRVSEVRSCITSGNITIVNLDFANSVEYPDHCPPGSYLILKRDKEVVSSMRMYHSARDKKVLSQYV